MDNLARPCACNLDHTLRLLIEVFCFAVNKISNAFPKTNG